MNVRGIVGVLLVGGIIGLAIWLFSGNPALPPQPNRLHVCATISPLADWVREVGGVDVAVHCLVDGSKDPHHFEPTAMDATKVSNSRAVFSIGLDLDEWADKLVENAGRGKGLTLFETGGWIEPRKLETHEIEIKGTPKAKPKNGVKPEAEEGHHHHGGGDPHYWHDPQRAMIVVTRIAKELSALDPAHLEGYEKRRDGCLAKLKALDERIEAAAKKIPAGSQVVTFHDAYGYLFERLHINVAAVVQVSPGVEPSLKDLTEALAAMRAIKQTVVFKEPSGSDDTIKKIADELGIKRIEILDPLDNENSPVGKNYFERMTHNIETLEKGLGN